MTFLFKIGFLHFSLIDILDILLVAFLIYHLYKLISGTIAVNIFTGMLIIYLMYRLVDVFQMKLLTSILGQFVGAGILATVVLFQQEIRKFLLILGRNTIFGNKNLKHLFQKTIQEEHADINIMIKAAKELSITKTGALIAFSKDDELDSFGSSGDLIDGVLSKRLLVALFNKTSPLHDGGVIITKGRIKFARCIFPVSDDESLPAEFGMRHRAAVGLSMETDCVVVVVSEETGNMSLSVDGKIYDKLDTARLRSRMLTFLYEEED